MSTRTLTFLFDRATKNTYRFYEVEQEGGTVVGTLYIQKATFKHLPSTLKVTIEAED